MLVREERVSQKFVLVCEKCGTRLILLLKSEIHVGRDDDSLRIGRSENRIVVGRDFSEHIQTGPGTHPSSRTMGTGSLSRRAKLSGHGVDHPHP